LTSRTLSLHANRLPSQQFGQFVHFVHHQSASRQWHMALHMTSKLSQSSELSPGVETMPDERTECQRGQSWPSCSMCTTYLVDAAEAVCHVLQPHYSAPKCAPSHSIYLFVFVLSCGNV